ncbi:MAG TPA: hypothetical protein DEB40_04205 [Elusimicrobia bacterium]|nr:hypothetical protein [Elusimicrobiota bacterium]HBT60928.1 hypothetical protein [Elusimicrobiota bacterium]
MRDELLDLARRLRRRVEQTHPSSWRLCAGPGQESRSQRLAALAGRIEACRLCPLGSQRLRAVPGVGSSEARAVFVGEGPGCEEDRRGEPFVDEAGELLDRILASIGLSRDAVFITNVVKCQSMKDPAAPHLRGNDRPPSPEEISACRPFLGEQLRVLAPRVIVALGAVAARVLLAADEPISRLRGGWRLYRDGDFTARLMPTYHPAALLRNPELKKDVWLDMKAIQAELEAGAP